MRGFLLLATALVATAFAQDGDYVPSVEGMKGMKVHCDSEETMAFVQKYNGVPGFDFLKTGSNFVDLFVTADQAELFTSVLALKGIKYTVFVENVKEKIEEERKEQEVARAREILTRGGFPSSKLSHTYYMDIYEINAYLKKLAADNKGLVTLLTVGYSFENREIYCVKLSTGGKNKPAILIDAGIHAREWIAPATALYVIDELVNNKANGKLVQDVDWYIVPVLNPDGYQYTHSASGNRLWRKTRSVNQGSDCRGTDGNRNYDMEWMTIGASSNPCAETYAGRIPFSETETRGMRDFVLRENQNKKFKVYMALHSYGQYILYPWGYTSKPASNAAQLDEAAKSATKAIASINRTQYTYGSSAGVLYPASGAADDWSYAVAGIELAYTIELPGGIYGFKLPASRIKSVGRETFEAMKIFHDRALGRKTA